MKQEKIDLRGYPEWVLEAATMLNNTLDDLKKAADKVREYQKFYRSVLFACEFIGEITSKQKCNAEGNYKQRVGDIHRAVSEDYAAEKDGPFILDEDFPLGPPAITGEPGSGPGEDCEGCS